ncbi:MAG: O-antigen ligase family protein [Verrucomicrobiota bacterium]
MMDLVKTFAILFAYLLAAPALGWLLARDRRLERAAFCLMVFMPSWFPGKLTLMVNSVELYRGHTKGFEASIIEIVAVALIVSAALRREKGFRWLPPGLWLYLAWCALSCCSIISADNKLYVLMAAVKFTKVALVFIGAFQAFGNKEDLRWMMHALAFSLVFQALVCLKLRYVDGQWQVKGWFEHQNPMAMWCYLCALPLLSVALAPMTPRRDTLFFATGVAAAGFCILLSVSRGGLGAFVAGACVIYALAVLRGFTWKLTAFAVVGLIAALAAGMLALDSMMVRVQEVNSRDEDRDLRAVLNQQCAAMLHDHPLGVGWNNFGVVNSLPVEKYAAILMDWDQSRGFRIIDENYLANPLTESLYWLLLAENGYPSLVMFVIFLLVTLWWAVRCTLAFWREPEGYFAAGVLIALFMTYFHGTVERVLTQTKNLSMWLIFAGCLARLEWRRQQGSSQAPPESSPAAGANPINSRSVNAL